MLALDATMTPDSASALCEYNKAHPSPRPRCTMPPRLTVIDAVDVHRSTSLLHHLATSPKTMASKGITTPKRHHHLIQGTQI
jgi:hypothetical protein